MSSRFPWLRNAAAISRTPQRIAALTILGAGLHAIRTREAIRRTVTADTERVCIAGQCFAWDEINRLLVVGVGKCALEAACALEEILGDRIDDGIVVDVRAAHETLTRIRARAGTHPFPSADNVAYTKEILTLLDGAGERDVVIAVISGGGSTLLCQPAHHTCEEETLLMRALFQHGIPIGEVNVVRKHLSLARGGNLAARAYPARMVALIFSDVPGDDISIVASGPTVRDPSTKEDALRVLARVAPPLAARFAPHLLETPKDAALFSRISHVVAVNNRIALAAMRGAAFSLEYAAEIASDVLEGDAEEVARTITHTLHHAAPRTVLLYGGETTVTVRDTAGKGGRNQHLALCALSHLHEGELLLACASDGRDNGPYAGALVDAETRRRAQEAGLIAEKYRARFDASPFFAQLEDVLETGYTGSNVADLLIAMKE